MQTIYSDIGVHSELATILQPMAACGSRCLGWAGRWQRLAELSFNSGRATRHPSPKRSLTQGACAVCLRSFIDVAPDKRHRAAQALER